MPLFKKKGGAAVPKVEDYYVLGKELGRGTFSVVKLATHKETKQQYAVKIIDRKTVGDKTEMIDTEISILKQVVHPNVITLKELFETDKKIYLIMELVTGGELFDKIVERGSYSEADARQVVLQILQAVAHLHHMEPQAIVHRDLKPENLLYATPDTASPIKLADFGLSKIIDETTMLKTACGTPGYVAPEVLKCAGYGTSVDIWSVGVIMYILLCGFPPFYEENTAALFEQIMAGKYDFPDPYWTNVSKSAIDLVKRMLVVDPAKRLTVDQALAHPWIQGAGLSTEHMPHVITEMKKFNARRKFKMAIHGVLGAIALKGAAGFGDSAAAAGDAK